MSDILIAFPKYENAKAIKNILIRNGYKVVGIAQSGSLAISLAESMGTGIVISAYRFADMLYTQLLYDLGDGFDMVLIGNQSKMEDNIQDNVIFLPMPLQINDLFECLDALIEKRYIQKKKKRLRPIKRTEEEKEIINKAKSILMCKNNMTEEQAHKYLQKCSMENGNNMLDNAKMIIYMND